MSCQPSTGRNVHERLLLHLFNFACPRTRFLGFPMQLMHLSLRSSRNISPKHKRIGSKCSPWVRRNHCTGVTTPDRCWSRGSARYLTDSDGVITDEEELADFDLCCFWGVCHPISLSMPYLTPLQTSKTCSVVQVTLTRGQKGHVTRARAGSVDSGSDLVLISFFLGLGIK